MGAGSISKLISCALAFGPDHDEYWDAVETLRRRGDHRAVTGVAQHARHPDAKVRLKVAVALPDLADDPCDPAPQIVHALLALMADEDREVRSWATFGLGTGLPADSPVIREALVRRATDPDDRIAGEALRALATRQDPRTAELLRQRLVRLADLPDDQEAVNLCAEAAACLADEALLPALAVHFTSCPVDERHAGWVDVAIDRCGQRRVSAAVAGTFGAARRLRVYDLGTCFAVDLLDACSVLLHARYATGPTGVLALVVAEQRWLAELAGDTSAAFHGYLARLRLDTLMADLVV